VKRTTHNHCAAAVLILAVAGISAAADNAVDVAPFGRQFREGNTVVLQWPEMRRVARLEIVFFGETAVPSPNALKVEYWQRAWRGAAIRRYAERAAGEVGWAEVDDWYNGKWKPADTIPRTTGRTLAFTFAPSDRSEFPDLEERGVTYRPTIRLRVSLPAGHTELAAVRVFTDSIWRTSELNIRFDKRSTCNDPLEVYNGKITARRAEAAARSVQQSRTRSIRTIPKPTVRS